jgi:hypothetical protein
MALWFKMEPSVLMLHQLFIVRPRQLAWKKCGDDQLIFNGAPKKSEDFPLLLSRE